MFYARAYARSHITHRHTHVRFVANKNKVITHGNRTSRLANQLIGLAGNKTTFDFDFLLGGRGLHLPIAFGLFLFMFVQTGFLIAFQFGVNIKSTFCRLKVNSLIA